MSQFLPEENKRKSTARLQGTLGIFMGLLYIAIAIIIGYRINSGVLPNGIFEIGKTWSWALVGVFVAYGVFRIYRGMKAYKSI